MSSVKLNRTVWIDRPWTPPIYVGFVPDEKSWLVEVKKLDTPDELYPRSNDAKCTFFSKGGKTVVLVTLTDDLSGRDGAQIASLLCHEAVHIWQEIRDMMREKVPGIEHEAYTIQAIAQSLMYAFVETRL